MVSVACVFKFIVLLLNCIYVIAGVAFVVLGLVFRVKIAAYSDILGYKYSYYGYAAATVVIVNGAVLISVAILGFVGVSCKNICILAVCAAALLVMFMLQVILGVYVFIVFRKNSSLVDGIAKTMEGSVDLYETKRWDTSLFNKMQSKFECCGVHGREDYFPKTLPCSCCPSQPKSCARSEAYKIGCFEVVWKFLVKTSRRVGYVALGFAGLELIGVVLNFSLVIHYNGRDELSFLRYVK